MPRLTRLAWPDHGRPALPPTLTAAELHARLTATRAAAAARGLDALAVYGDREHAANLHWLTGFDPRFEEAVLALTPGTATLLVGNECLPYAAVSPLVADGTITVLHCPSLSLVSQPRGGLTIAAALAAAIPAGARTGAAGWKYFETGEVADPATTLDWPAFLADPLRDRAGSVTNATDLFMHPGHGLRARVDAAGIARLEFANAMAVRAVKRLVAALAEGATDFDIVEAAGIGGLPLGCHATLACGDRAFQGMSSPTGQTLRLGSPLSFNVCHWGANICRAGWIARRAADLPPAAQGTLEAFVFPYVQAMSDWCALMRPGVTGDAVAQAMARALPADPFGVTLNPGHLIGTDEWMSSPIFPGSDMALASGMAMQMDVIPGHPVHASTRMEDGYVIADAGLRADLATRFPAVAARCTARAAFMRDVIGMDVPDTLLPLADTCGIVAPWLLDAGLVVTLH
jgi:Xaa-Pro aminopeptidase